MSLINSWWHNRMPRSLLTVNKTIDKIVKVFLNLDIWISSLLFWGPKHNKPYQTIFVNIPLTKTVGNSSPYIREQVLPLPEPQQVNFTCILTQTCQTCEKIRSTLTKCRLQQDSLCLQYMCMSTIANDKKRLTLTKCRLQQVQYVCNTCV